jgi:ferredoxin
MRLVVHDDHCIGSGACVVEAPRVFKLADSGLVIVLDTEPPVELHDSVRKAAAACPVAVIEIVE